MMTFSVIVPFLNEESYISRCVQSLLVQDFPRENYEIIFIDNQSVDASSSIIRKLEGQVLLLSEKKSGSYAARNKGIRYAKGQVLAFTDADCLVDVHWLSNAHELLKNKNVDVLLGKVDFHGRSRSLEFIEDYEDSKKEFIFGQGHKKNFFGHTNNMFVRKAVFDQFGLFSEELRGMDTEFVQRCANGSEQISVKYSPLLLVHHLEIERLTDWINKMMLYSNTSQVLEMKSGYKVLSFSQRLEIMAECRRKNNYSVFGSGCFYLTLVVVGVCFDLLRFFQRFTK